MPDYIDKNLLNHYGYVICARNEENTIERLISSIQAQDYPQDRIHIYVVADNCTDRTEEISRRCGATVYRRENAEKIGKGYALQYLFDRLLKQPETENIKGFFFFDADNYLDAQFTAEMHKVIAEGHQIVCSYRDSSNWGSSLSADCAALLFVQESYLFNPKKMKTHTSCIVRGTGFYLDRQVLNEENGWNYVLMTEDTDLTASQIVQRRFIAYAEKAVFFDEQPITHKQAWKQKKRWSKGLMQCYDHYAPTLKRLLKEKNRQGVDGPSISGIYTDLFGTRVFAPASVFACVLACVAAGILLPWKWALWFPLLLLAVVYCFFAVVFIPTVIRCRERIKISGWYFALVALVYPFYYMEFLLIDVLVLFSQKV